MTDNASAPTAEATPPAWARGLGYAGLIPFGVLVLVGWFAPSAFKPMALQALAAYGATIASFLGAIHWGLAMRSPLPSKTGPYLWGVVPSLVAWVALLLTPIQAFVTLALLLILCLAIDMRSYPAYGLRPWLRMRIQLTAVAVLTLGVGVAIA